MFSQIMEKMIAFSDGNIHDIDHLIRVWTYSKTIGELEGLDAQTQIVLEAAAITHDIACPLCREKYGNTNGKHQEQEGEVMVKDFLAGTGMSEEQVKRVAFLVGHHHTFIGIDGIDYQILVEADYIANATENGYSRQNVANFMQKVMKTESGKRILKSIFALNIHIPVCNDDRRFVCTAKNASICLRATAAPTAGRAMSALSSPMIPVSWLKRVRRGTACWRTCSTRMISRS